MTMLHKRTFFEEEQDLGVDNYDNPVVIEAYLHEHYIPTKQLIALGEDLAHNKINMKQVRKTMQMGGKNARLNDK